MSKFGYYELSMKERKQLLKNLVTEDFPLLNETKLILTNVVIISVIILSLITWLSSNYDVVSWGFLIFSIVYFIGFLLWNDIRYLKFQYDIECNDFSYYYVSIDKCSLEDDYYKIQFSIQGKSYEDFIDTDVGKRVHVFFYKNTIFSHIETE